MGQSEEDDELEIAIQACRRAADGMSMKRSFRLRVLIKMVRNELDKEKVLRTLEHGNGNHTPGGH